MLSDLSRDRQSGWASAPGLTVSPRSTLSINPDVSFSLKLNFHSFQAYRRLMGQSLGTSWWLKEQG